eukprot:TRINITY_DN6223_c0_g2_i1.p1 TRINITY_DN6223_c0_g2~~TRINITY_DN6223_c0_g2_i1.p1  ORF type:complete len:407 (+),score=150.12 TRINITY_DN6223_c0_g2_i1:57-1277(+)
MASTVDSKRVKERFDTEEELQTKLDTLAAFVRDSANTTFFTGAGMSTSAGVSDYRGPSGAWTKRKIAELQGKTDAASRTELAKLLAEMKKEDKKAAKAVPMTDAKPTFAHMAQAALIQKKKAHHVVTTNLDGLYRKTGLKQHKHFTCLHGDMYVERCTGCRKEYERNYHVRDRKLHVHNHSVGVCGECGSAPPKGKQRVDSQSKGKGTIDTHINFGEELDDHDWFEAEAASQAAELCIVMGTSMSLRHVTHFPFMAQRTVICNLQATPDDAKCDLRIWATCDAVLMGLVERLGVVVPPPPVWRPADPLPLNIVRQRASAEYYEGAKRLMAEAFPELAQDGAVKRPVVQRAPAKPKPKGGAPRGAKPPTQPLPKHASSMQTHLRKAAGSSMQAVREIQKEYTEIGVS